MEVKLYIIFIVLNVVNVVIQTIKSIATVKCDKVVAAIINAVAYGLYTIVTVYMLCELPLTWKAFIVAMCNLVGVYVVKYFEEKGRKDKIWLVKITIPTEFAETAKSLLEKENISFTYYNLNKYYVFDNFCENQKETETVIQICKTCKGKAFATENKLSL